MLIKQINEYLPRMLEASYNYLRRDPPNWYTEFYSGGDLGATRALASLVLRALELEASASASEERKSAVAGAKHAFEVGDYFAVIHTYMPELGVRWDVLKAFFAEVRAYAIEDGHNTAIDDDDRDFNLRNQVSPEAWECLRQRIREAIQEKGITPRVPF